MTGIRARGVNARTAPMEICDAVTRYLQRRRYDAEPRWPLVFSVRWPDQRTLTAQAPDWHRANNALREWSQRQGCPVTNKHRLMVTPVELIDTVTVADEQTALRIADRASARHYRKARQRINLLADECSIPRDTAASVAKMLDSESDVDVTLVIRAAQFFGAHDATGLTPRQVPLAGFSAKWLDQTHRRNVICTLCGKDSLGLSDRPPELRMRWLDPAYSDEPEMMITRPWRPGGERDIRYVIIVENKDTYQSMPDIAHGLCVWGAGKAILASIALLLPWLTTARPDDGDDSSPQVVYWGDMDADGLEILDAVRHTGVRCKSLFMDLEAYQRYSWFGTNLTSTSTPLTSREPKATPTLDFGERELYLLTCGEAVGQSDESGLSDSPTHLRVEQERIPLIDAADALRSLGWPIAANNDKETQ